MLQDHLRTACARSHQGAAVCRREALSRGKPPPSLTLHLSSAVQLEVAFHQDRQPYSVPRLTPLHSIEALLFVSPAFQWLLSLRLPLPMRALVRLPARPLYHRVKF